MTAIPISEAPLGISKLSRGFNNLVSKLEGLLFPIGLLIIWEIGVKSGWVNAHLLPPPSELLDVLSEQIASGVLLQHIAVSSVRVLVGFGIGAGLGILAGAIVGLSKRVESLFDPTFQAVRAIPSLAWVPLLLLWLGIDETPKITLIAIGGFFPVYLNVVAGFKNVDRKLVEVGSIYGLSTLELIWRIFIPASLPNLFTGLRTGLSLSWMFLVAAELIAATRGLGYLLTDGRETGRADLVIVAIIVLAVLGKITDGFLLWLENRLLRWRDTFKAGGVI